jgi:hypothetical protein
MAFNMRSIMGRNNPNPGPAFPGQANPSNKLTWGDVETAKAHGITSRRTMKKNLGDIRTVQNSQATRNMIERGAQGYSGIDPFSDMADKMSDSGGAGNRLMAAGFKNQNSMMSRARGALSDRNALQGFLQENTVTGLPRRRK